MWQFLLVVGSAGTHPLPPVSYAIPLWAYALFLQAALAAAALVGGGLGTGATVATITGAPVTAGLLGLGSFYLWYFDAIGYAEDWTAGPRPAPYISTYAREQYRWVTEP